MDTLLIILAVAVPLCSIATFFITRFADAHKKGSLDGEMKSDVGYIKEMVKDISKKQTDTDSTLKEYFKDIVNVSRDAKAAHERLDVLIKRVENIETKIK